MAAHGRHRLHDRRRLHREQETEKEMIVQGGINVYPAEIERSLDSCPHSRLLGVWRAGRSARRRNRRLGETQTRLRRQDYRGRHSKVRHRNFVMYVTFSYFILLDQIG